MKSFLLLIFFFSVTVLASAGNWPSFRGPNASGVADGKPTPTSWDAVKGTNIVWKTPIPGLAHSCPVVVGDRVYVTTAISSGNDRSRLIKRQAVVGREDLPGTISIPADDTAVGCGPQRVSGDCHGIDLRGGGGETQIG